MADLLPRGQRAGKSSKPLARRALECAPGDYCTGTDLTKTQLPFWTV